MPLIVAPSSNHGVSRSSPQATIDALSSESEKITPYQKLYPGFDPEEDLEVNPSWLIDICKWSNCHGVQCRVDKMWWSHIFAEVSDERDKSHKVEILAPKKQLPGGKVRCMWKGCERSVLCGCLKKHIEDVHLHLYRLKCIHCGTEKRREAYRETHGPARMCPKNPRALPSPRPQQRPNLSIRARARPMPPPPLRNPNPEPLVPSPDVSSYVPPPAKNNRNMPYPQVLHYAPFMDDAPSDTRARGRLHSVSSSSTPAATMDSAYQDSLTQMLDERMQRFFVSRSRYLSGRRPAPGAGGPEGDLHTPAAVMALQHQQRYATFLRRTPPAAPHAFAPIACVKPESLVVHRPTDTSESSQAVSTSQTRDGGDPKTQMGDHRAVPGGRPREAPHPAGVPPPLLPQAMLARALNPQRHTVTHHQAPTAPTPSAPQCIAPELLRLNQPTETSTLSVSPAVLIAQTRDGDPETPTPVDERRDAREVPQPVWAPPPRRLRSIQAVQHLTAAPAPAQTPLSRTWNDVLDAPGPAGAVATAASGNESSSVGVVVCGLFDRLT